MTEANGTRYQAWLDGLEPEQLAMVQRTEGMPIEMAVHFMWVDLDEKIAALNRPLWKQALTPFAFVAAVIAAAFGPDVPRIGG